MFRCVAKFIRSRKNPKYLVMKGIQVEDRFIAFLGANPVYGESEFGVKTVTFSNQKYEYWASNTYKRIYTMRELYFWRRLLGSGTKVITKRKKKHVRVGS